MTLFVDTSAVLALLVPTDRYFGDATTQFERLRTARMPLWTTSYMLIELYSILARRFGLDAVARVRRELAPLIEVVWVDATLHDAALDYLLELDRRKVSLVDATSFVAMHRRGTMHAFTFDRHFVDAGFEVLPERIRAD